MVRYRIILDGALGPGLESWFLDTDVTVGSSQTVLEVAVADQSALHGILRRVHDLHLTLASVEKIAPTDQIS